MGRMSAELRAELRETAGARTLVDWDAAATIAKGRPVWHLTRRQAKALDDLCLAFGHGYPMDPYREKVLRALDFDHPAYKKKDE